MSNLFLTPYQQSISYELKRIACALEEIRDELREIKKKKLLGYKKW